MSTHESITCRKCGRTSYNKNDVLHGWCDACKLWQYEVDNPNTGAAAPPIQLDLIIGDLQRSHRVYMRDGSRITLLFEQFTGKDARLYWRACLMLNGRATQHSRREQLTPQDALRELHELCKGTKPEDI